MPIGAAGVIVIAIVHGRPGFRELGSRLVRWRVGWPWYQVALLPLGLDPLATALSGSLAASALDGETLVKILFGPKAGILVAFFLRGAMGEEPGMRGFAPPRLQTRVSPFRVSRVIGALWAAWHIPLLHLYQTLCVLTQVGAAADGPFLLGRFSLRDDVQLAKA